MKFEEAIELIEDECRVEAEDGFSTKEKDLDTFLALSIIKNLQETYAPKIKMTKIQFGWFEEARKKYKNLEGIYIALYFGDEKSRGISFEMLMQAWLHPELIEVTDD